MVIRMGPNAECYSCGEYYHEATPIKRLTLASPCSFRCKACWAKFAANGYDDSQEDDWE